ncbi:MAG: 3-hydroxyacyl-CoA dehydrogenase NAD-binding domain-containing protein [Alphaproteobacteria bacterium]
MKMENFKWEKDADGIVTITWDMPGRSMNVLSVSAIREIGQWVDGVTKDAGVKGVVLTSGRPTAFGAGADLSEMEGNAAATSDASVDPLERLKRMYDGVMQLHGLVRAIEKTGKPIVAAINGTVLGGCFEITLGCHCRIAADNPKTQIGCPEAKVGVMPGGGGTQRMPRLMGAQNALPLLLEGKTLDPQGALKANLIHKVVPEASLISEAKRWIKDNPKPTQPWDDKGFRMPGGGPYDKASSFVFTMGNAMLRKQSYGNYPAQIGIMKAVYEGIQVPIDAALRIEARYFVDVLSRPESKAMVRSLFLSMQELAKGARRPKGVPESKVKKLGVLGAGVMGAGIAYVSALAGIEVVLLDRDQPTADKGKDYSVKILDKDIARGRATEQKKTDVLSRIHPTADYAQLSGCDLIIEAVYEDKGIKADVTKKVDAVVPKTTVFASNTSTLPILGLSEAFSRPESFIGIHFFSPVERMGLVEIIVSKKTSPEALARAIDYVGQIKKTPIVVNDKRGFYTSRCFGTYTGEGLKMWSEGIHPALIENAGRMAGMPMGPLEVLDSVGNDTPIKIMRATRKALDIAEPDEGEKLMAWLVEENGRLGRKSGKGFYDYDGTKRLRLWPNIVAKRSDWNTEADVEELKKRILYIQALETARCFEEEVVTDPRDADVGSILGWGFAPYSGGTLSFIDSIGTAKFVKECEKLAKAHGDRFKPNKLLKEMAKNNETFYGRFKPAKAT